MCPCVSIDSIFRIFAHISHWSSLLKYSLKSLGSVVFGDGRKLVSLFTFRPIPFCRPIYSHSQVYCLECKTNIRPMRYK